jgi:transposase
MLHNFSVQTSRWGPRVMVWGAISWEGVFSFSFIEGKMTAKSYKTLLERHIGPHLAKFRDGELIFQQDNAPVHSARTVEDYLEKRKVLLLPWPPQSPDLNLIENVWASMKRELKYSYANEQELKNHVVSIWNSMKLSYIQNLYHSIRSRLQAVVRAKGGPTKY